MSPSKKARSLSSRRAASAEVQLRPERELRAITDRVLRIAKSTGIPETEVHVDEVIDALTRFANNSIHQHVAEHGLTVSLRVVVDGRTARVTTNRIEEDALRAVLESAASLAAPWAIGAADHISAAAPMISNRIECGAQIGDEVAGIFYADGNSDQSIGNAEALARLPGDAGMRRACGMRYQGFGAS